jgi:hypothetical protein
MSRLSFLSVREPADNDALVAGLPSPALVINAIPVAGRRALPARDRGRVMAWRECSFPL